MTALSCDAQLRFPADPTSVGQARSCVLNLLEECGIDRDNDIISLLVSEMATNAIRHARSPFGLRAEMDADHVRVEVSDTAAAMPVVREPSEFSTNGRGMMLVETFAENWGVRSLPTGKVVWFEVHLR